MMNKKILGAAVGVVAVATLLAGCTSSSTPDTSAQSKGQAQTETAFQQQSAAVPYPASQLRDSVERRNLREHLLRTNNPNLNQFVYVMTITGEYVGYYAIKGKVTSTQSQMTTSQLIETKCHYQNACNDMTVPAPGDDGSYGDNEPGIFFFTTEGVMVTTDMPYIVSDQILPVDAKKLNPVK